MADYGLARKIIEAVCKNTNLPVSIKIRAGISLNSPEAKLRGITHSAVDFTKKIKDLPFSAVMVHCRTYEQGFSGVPDYSIAEKIKKIIPAKIVLANGGINSVEDANKILKDFPNIDGLGIARGALGQPWIFTEIRNKFHPERSVLKSNDLIKLDSSAWFGMTNYDVKKILLSHLRLAIENKGSQGFKEFRAHLGWYVKGFPGASELRRKLVITKNISELKKILGNIETKI
jgi:tRNA-dihydrouridine synthase B